MDFIRKHMFLLVLAAVVVVVGGVLLTLWSSLSGDVRERFALREELGRNVLTLGNERINEQWVKAKEQWVKDIGVAFEDLQVTAKEMNQRGRDVPKFAGDGAEQIPAFPVDADKHELHNIQRRFRSWYLEELRGLVSQLTPTAIPSASEREDARRRAAAMAQLTARPRATTGQDAPILPAGVQKATATPLSPESPVPNDRETFTPMAPGGGPAGPMPFGSGGGLASTVSEEALRKAIDTLKLQKAREGHVYVTWDDRSKSLHEYSSWDIGGKPTFRQMWEAMVNLWIQRDLVAAIKATNDKVFASNQIAPADRNVLEAAIKHLVAVQVDGYYGLAPTPSGTMGPSMRQPMMGPFMAPDAGGAAGTSGAPEAAKTLTGRNCNPTYDVVTFRVTVVMNETELKTFIDQMERRNFYTALNVEMSQVKDVLGQTMSGRSAEFMPMAEGMGGDAAGSDLYYYGTKPAMQVTLTFEALLFTEWERPLMPQEMIDALNALGGTSTVVP